MPLSVNDVSDTTLKDTCLKSTIKAADTDFA